MYNSYYIEKYAPEYLAVFLAFILTLITDTSVLLEDMFILDKTIDITGILFGFLLTVLVLLLEIDNKKVQLLKEYNRYSDLLDYNKRAIFYSGITGLYSFILIILFQYPSFIKDQCCKQLAMYVFIYMISSLVGLVLNFLRIFFRLITG